MKTLKEICLEASILDKVENTLTNGDQQIKDEIVKFLEKRFKFRKGSYTISDNPNDDGKYVVDASGDVEAANNYTLTELTNEYFVWGKVRGLFNIAFCSKLTTLEGGPTEVGKIWVSECNGLTSLKGAPKRVRGNFSANDCKELKTLDTGTETVEGDFDICYCSKLTDVKGAPKRVWGQFKCLDCVGLYKNNISRKDIEDNCRVEEIIF
jgi:hypothetical protein